MKVLSVDGNRIKLSRKAVLKEQRAKLGLPDPAAPTHEEDAHRDHGVEMHASAAPRRAERSQASSERQPASNASTITLEGGDDFDDDNGAEGGVEPNFNRVDGATPATSETRSPAGGDPRRRRRRGRPGGSGGGRRN